ncbi:hypothetical protein FGIG_01008 [Fasciola gigantica]|uniref:SCP domain-containing protein n=1 Tax=Fasciola gigantica TaxID=46835 RepID=A0A504YQX5_FASGI|nr:hypothetical protein FGIG_01008 [Fasciola gigantica]
MKKGILLVITLYELLIVSNFVVNGRPSENDALNKFMLQKHNELRSNLTKCNVRGQPPPVEMPMLRYDQELADLAQQWVDQCKIGYDPDGIPTTSSWKNDVGQNWIGFYSFQKGTIRNWQTWLNNGWINAKLVMRFPRQAHGEIMSARTGLELIDFRQPLICGLLSTSITTTIGILAVKSAVITLRWFGQVHEQ